MRVQEDRLVCNAPKGALTEEFRREIRLRKPEIIAFLNSAQPRNGARENMIKRLAPGAVRPPLSFSQQRIWYCAQLEPNSISANLPAAYRLCGTLSTQAFTEAFNAIVRRHESIRTTVGWDGEAPYQIIAPVSSIELPFQDLSTYPSAQCEQVMNSFIKGEYLQPFNLAQGPLLRAHLIKTADAEHVFFLMPHHAIWDGWSFDLFLEELDAFYRSALTGEPDNLPELSVTYKDYAAWQHETVQGAALEKLLEYWLKKLGGELPHLEMATDFPRPPLVNLSGVRQHLHLSSDLKDALTRLAHSENTTLYTVLLAAFKVLLCRYSGQKDIIVGTPVLGRTRPEIENLIGFFVNLLVLRTDLSGSLSFRELLKRVRETCLSAYSHQGVPFERLVERLNPERDLSRTPLFQAMFTYQDVTSRSYRLGDVAIRKMQIDTIESPTDIHLFAEVTRDNIICGFDYCKSLFSDDTMKRFSDNFHVLLTNIAASPEESIARLPIVTENETLRIINEFNVTDVEYSDTAGVNDLFETQASRVPEKTAAVFENSCLTYGELSQRSNQLARYLRRLGVGPEKLVGIFVERSLSMLVGLLGILKAGGAYVPLDPLFPKERLSFMLEDAGVSVLITQKSLEDALPHPEGMNVLCLDAGWPDIAQESSDNPSEKTNPDHPAYVIYTSGSTGLPKGVEVTHRALVNFLCSMREEPGITADDVLLAVTTLSFDIAGLELYLPLIAGAQVVIAPRDVVADGVRLTALLKESGATIMQATPITWRILLEAGWQGNRRLKILCGGEAFPADLAGPLLDRSAEVWNMYGPTETTIWSTVHRIRDKGDPLLIGRPIANTQIYILDEHMMPVPIGVAGELNIGGDGLARGYLNRPELTAERFVTHAFKDNHRERLYKTGDLARYRHDGTIECLGRSDFQVKIRGYRIELGEIETVLQRHPAVRSAVVAARDAGGGDKRLIAYLICEPSAEQPSAQALRELARATLPAYMMPSAYVFLDSFPLTPNGKINRAALPAPDAAAQADDADEYTPPRNAIERTIASLWQSLLQVKRVGIHDSFFEIGGHSLLAVQLFARLEKIFHKQLPLATLFEAQTVEKLAAIILSKDWKPSWASLVPVQPGGSKPLFFCVHGAGGNVLLYRDLARHMGADQPFYGLQAKGLDGKQPFHTRIEDMAADYIQEIRQLQPEGPYCLGGYCMGGDIAFEMARQLVRQGQTVAFLALLDTQRQWITNLKPYIKWYQRYQQIAFHIRNFLQADMQGKRGFLLEKASEAGRRIKRRYDIARSEIAYALKLRVDKPLVLMEKINDNASIAYQPAPYPGRVTLFCPRTNYAGYNDPLYGWGNRLTAGVDVQQLSSYPAGMLVEPFVAELAEKMKACLENASAQQGSAVAP